MVTIEKDFQETEYLRAACASIINSRTPKRQTGHGEIGARSTTFSVLRMLVLSASVYKEVD